MTAKQSAQEVLDHLPDKATWDEILYELRIRRKIEAGLNDVDEGRSVPHDQIKSRIAAYARRQT